LPWDTLNDERASMIGVSGSLQAYRPRIMGRHARRWAAILVAAASLAGALSALAGVAPDRASAGERLGWGGTSVWHWRWETFAFAVSGPGVVDIWTTCRQKFTALTYHQLLVGPPDSTSPRRINVRCDRRGHWIRRVGIPRNTWLTVEALALRGDGFFCRGQCATGWTSVYRSS
jgi:hypothetical protein